MVPAPAQVENSNDLAWRTALASTFSESRRVFFYPLSVRKLIVMYIFTFGLFGIHWFYKQWDFIRCKDARRLNPALRAIFAGIFAYPLFRAIRVQGKEAGANIGWSAALLYVFLMYPAICSAIFSEFASLLWLPAGCASVAPLAIVQRTINKLNDSSQEDYSYSKLNILGIVIGSIVLLLTIVGSLGASSK